MTMTLPATETFLPTGGIHARNAGGNLQGGGDSIRACDRRRFGARSTNWRVVKSDKVTGFGTQAFEIASSAPKLQPVPRSNWRRPQPSATRRAGREAKEWIVTSLPQRWIDPRPTRAQDCRSDKVTGFGAQVLEIASSAPKLHAVPGSNRPRPQAAATWRGRANGEGGVVTSHPRQVPGLRPTRRRIARVRA
jgi:hypothetical protein